MATAAQYLAHLGLSKEEVERLAAIDAKDPAYERISEFIRRMNDLEYREAIAADIPSDARHFRAGRASALSDVLVLMRGVVEQSKLVPPAKAATMEAK